MPVEYNPEDKEQMKRTAHAKNKSLLQELIDYMRLNGYHKIGIANCAAMQKYADRLAEILRGQGFAVMAVNCKESGLKGCSICEDIKGPCCDPLYQAAVLNEAETEFNINVGLCLGHGLLFQKYSHAEVTTFLVKDFATKHKPIESLEQI